MGYAIGASQFYGQWKLGADSQKLVLKAVVSSVESNWMLLVAEQQGVELEIITTLLLCFLICAGILGAWPKEWKSTKTKAE